MKGTKVQAEDLLLNITGGSIGRCCVVPKDFDTGNINQHVAIIRLVHSYIGYYLHHVICSPYFQNMIIELQTGAGREGLPKNKMDKILIALPPEKEQKILNEKVETLKQKCVVLDKEIKTSEANAQILMQAVLKEAFEGKK
ncbi:restriction endonuclease subunit S [Flavobacteriaceae bacterium]|nr:restriction endonuclease subunit S [Flavobacteriaceae bacterium]